MCGRYILTLPIATVAEELEIEDIEFEIPARYNIAPTQRMPVLTQAPRRLELMRWGLIPSWAKDPRIGSSMINARAETLAEKPAFRQALQQRRCLIPADGFYEWQLTGIGKLPQFIHLVDRKLMTFGGLWESWRDAEGREIRSYTIITTTPNADMAPVHDRMPVIIPPDKRATWLAATTSIAETEALMVPLPDGLLTRKTVGDLVNSARNEGPDLLLPPQTLF